MLDAGGVETFLDNPQVQRCNRFVRDDCRPHARQAARDLRAGSLDQLATDQDVVGAVAEIDPYGSRFPWKVAWVGAGHGSGLCHNLTTQVVGEGRKGCRR